MFKEKSFLKSLSIFIVGIIISVIVTYYVKKENDKSTKQELEISSNDIKAKIQNRLNVYIQFSRTSSSYIMSSDTITRNDWRNFVEKSKVAEHLNGFQGVAFIESVPDFRLEKHIARFSQELGKNYAIFPNRIHKTYTPIVYIEPLIDRNLKALGFNVSSNPLMKFAIEKARDSNQVILTDKVTLIQEGSSEPQPGIVIYSPIYKKNLPINTVKNRRDAIAGWAAISFRMNDFMEGVIGNLDVNKPHKIDLKIYDRDSISNEFLLFDSSKINEESRSKSITSTLLLPVELNDKNWTLQFSQPKNSFFTSVNFIVLLSGIAFSFLLSFLIFSLLSTISLAERMANNLTINISDKNKELVSTNNLLKESYSELKIAKEKSEESEEKLKLIANNLVNGMLYQVIMLNDTKRKFNYVSDAVSQLYGCEAFEVLENANLIYDKIHKDDINELTRKEKESLDKMSVFKTEARVINPDGGIRWSYFVSKPRNINGLVCWDGIEVDITEQKKVEKELQLAKEKAEESNYLKTEFLNNMSHEIRTPLNGILGFSNLLNKPNLTDEKRKNYVKIIQSSGQQLLQIINDILDISILGTKQIKVIENEICLNDLMMELFSIFDIKAKENRTPLYLKNELSDRRSTILTDKTKLNKVISNLLENSLKFTNEGNIELGYHLINNQLEIYVKDTGIGIEKENHESIFERFSQAEKDLSKKTGGLGLGLSIVKENVELLGGNIRLESEKGAGATFLVTIPYKPVFIDDESDKKKSNIKNTILVVEDEEVNFLYVEALLNELVNLNINILHAKNGLEAIEFCKINDKIDLVLMDLKMPILNGYESTAQIKEFRHNLPIIALTSYTATEEREKAISVGCDDFLSKPINVKIFSNLIEKYLVQ